MKNKYRKLGIKMWRNRWLYGMLLPAIVAIFIFQYVPIYGAQIAFRDFNPKLGFFKSTWVGLKYFRKFFNYPYVWELFRNTLSINLLSLLTFPLPIILAIMLNEMKNQALKKTCQMIQYAPHFVSTVVVCSMVTLFLARDGLFNIIGGLFGAETRDFLAEPKLFAPIYVISGEWQSLGWGTIIYMATLSGVSPELIEAARLDGASRMQVIRHVYIPHIKPTIVTLLILRIGSLVGVGFEKVLLLQNPLNMEASRVISTYVYSVGMLNQNFSYSTAIGLFNNFINVVLIIIANTVSRKVSETSLW